MKIAVEGCAHGELDKIYAALAHQNVDLLICCGDFQSTRDKADMESMAVPPKFRDMKDFHKYYTGTKKAPVLTLFIGGNHEAANYLWQLPYGGWVCDNIYYMGYASVVDFAGLRIAGLSGIYKSRDYTKSHFERPPFTEDTKRSFYHQRSIDVAKLKLLEKSDKQIDILITHDWPCNIAHYGNKEQLCRFKPYFRKEIDDGSLGSTAGEDLLKTLKPVWFFAGHLHCKFTAEFPHEDGSTTKFLALDKCLPKRRFLEILDIAPSKARVGVIANPDDVDNQLPLPDGITDMDVGGRKLRYDKEWLTILRETDSVVSNRYSTSLDNIISPKMISETECLCNGDFEVLPYQASKEMFDHPLTADFCVRFQVSNLCNPKGNSKFSRLPQHTTFQAKPRISSMSLPKPKNDDSMTSQNPSTDKDFEHISRPSVQKPKKTQTEDEDDDFGVIRRPVDRQVGGKEEDDLSGLSDDDSSSSESDIDLDEYAPGYNSSFNNTSLQMKRASIFSPNSKPPSSPQTKQPLPSTKLNSTPLSKMPPASQSTPINKDTRPASNARPDSVSSPITSNSSAVKKSSSLPKPTVTLAMTFADKQNISTPPPVSRLSLPKPKNTLGIDDRSSPNPLKSKAAAVNDSLDDNSSVDGMSTPSIKKPKIIRRNQSMYTPTEEEE